MRANVIALAVLAAVLELGCSSADIPQAYRGVMFDKTGPVAFYSGKTGFTGPVLGPGTYFTATYNEIHKVECSTITVREPLNALTQDGVQFGLNIYVRFSPNCSDKGIRTILTSLPVDENNSVTAYRIYQTYVQPAVGEAVREVISPVRANDINDHREAILAQVRKRFLDMISHRDKHVAMVYEVNLSNLDFPADMDRANTERAIQAILRDKAIAQRDRVTAEIKTAEMSRELAEKQGAVEAARIEQVGEALRRYPAFLQYDLQQRMPEIYRQAGAQGNMIITAPNPSVFVPDRRVNVASEPPPVSQPAPKPTSASTMVPDSLSSQASRVRPAQRSDSE